MEEDRRIKKPPQSILALYTDCENREWQTTPPPPPTTTKNADQNGTEYNYVGLQ